MLGLNREKASLLPHDKEWKIAFENEKNILSDIFGDHVIDIQHIGSTALPICAKPIIDILVGVDSLNLSEHIMQGLESVGYEYRPKASYSYRLFFAKGSTNNRTHHLHIVEHDSNEWNNLLLFKNYLLKHKDALNEYEQLKKNLAAEHGDCRKLYTEGKSKFILNVISLTLLISLACAYAAGANEVKFDNQDFVLKATAQSLNVPNALNEYFPKGESHDHWTKMIGVYHIPEEKDPIKYAEEIDKDIEKAENCVLLKFVKNNKTDQAVISYLENGQENGQNFFTYNVYKYEKNPVKGITEFKYAIKYFFKNNDEIVKLAQTVKNENDKYMTMLISSPIPPIVEKELN